LEVASAALVAKCLPTTLQVLFGLIVDDGQTGTYSVGEESGRRPRSYCVVTIGESE
jgi:hypothetical protein